MPDKSIEVITQNIRLTHEGANIVLNRCIEKALEIGVPQNIAVVDNAGHLLCFTRLDGSKFHSIDTAIAKARASASTGMPSGKIPFEPGLMVSIACPENFTNLQGGLPIVIHDTLIGGIGVGSGTPDQDIEVAQAGLSALLSFTDAK